MMSTIELGETNEPRPPETEEPAVKKPGRGPSWSIMDWVITGSRSYKGTASNPGSSVNLVGMVGESGRTDTITVTTTATAVVAAGVGTNGVGYRFGDEYDDGDDDDDDSDDENRPERVDGKGRKRLSRKIRIPSTILTPYRLIGFLRFAALVLFIIWRLSHVNSDAVWLWGISIVCEIWFAITWLLDQLPKLSPINRETYLKVLEKKFERTLNGRSDLPAIDVFVSTADPEKEPSLVTANTVLSILAADYPVEKLACYVSDDGGSLLTFEAMDEAADFAKLWVPFCKKHDIEPRNPESYFNSKRDPYNYKVRVDFVKDRRRVKREYDEFKVRINGLPDMIHNRSDALNAREEEEAVKRQLKAGKDDEAPRYTKNPKATWMSNNTQWAGTWLQPKLEHTKSDHAGIIQVLAMPPASDPVFGSTRGINGVDIDLTGIDMRVPMLVYMSREKRQGFEHNKKAGAMNALVRASAVMSNGPFILNLDCDHYVNNSQAFREAICFMMDPKGDHVAFIQFPQRFEGIDPSDRYSNRNKVFFDANMRALDGLQGPAYVGTGCMFRRTALYGFDPPRFKILRNCCGWCFPKRHSMVINNEEEEPLEIYSDLPGRSTWSKRFGNSLLFLDSIEVAEYRARPVADHPSITNGREPGSLTGPCEPLTQEMIKEAINVISCWYEKKTEWGNQVGWVYGSVTEDVVTGYKMHTRGWRSVYCITKRDAFRGTAPINLTDRLQQALRWATGSVEIFFSKNNGILGGPKLKFFQRIAYLNVGIYPFTSIFLIVYCFVPALSLFSGQFIVQSLNVTFLVYLLIITITLCILAGLELKWSGISLDDWWRNEQFWMIGGTSAHLAAVIQGLLKVIGGIDISFTLTSKATVEDEDDEFAELYIVKWTSLMIPPITIMMVNIIAVTIAIGRELYSANPNWGKLLGGVFFSIWVLMHLYPFAKGLMGRGGKTPAVVFIWAGLVSITIALLCVSINPSSDSARSDFSGASFP
ncbi:hypothetical protein LUZ60_011658 [Juncus effusus]|nr:hypothetical protein LUZ60_011658 [Juncus effusus]